MKVDSNLSVYKRLCVWKIKRFKIGTAAQPSVERLAYSATTRETGSYGLTITCERWTASITGASVPLIICSNFTLTYSFLFPSPVCCFCLGFPPLNSAMRYGKAQ